MTKIKNKQKYPVKFPLDIKDYAVGTCSKTGKTISIEMGAVMGQSFDLELLGKKCITYPVSTNVDCETGETVELPLQIVQVLLAHENILCQLLETIQEIQNDCCDDCTPVIKTIMVYNENSGEPDEWDVSRDNSLNSLVVLDSNNDAQTGNVSIYYKGVTVSPDAEVYFKSQEDIEVSKVKELKFFAKHLPTTDEYIMKLVFLKGSQEGTAISIVDGVFGMSMSNIGWNEITIPLSASMFPDVDFDSFVLTVAPKNVGENVTDLNIDNVRLITEESDCSGGGNENQPPVVDAGESIGITTSSFTASATASDSDGSIVSVSWSVLTLQNISITNGNTLTPTFNNMPNGTHTFQVTVTDNNGATATDTMTLLVNVQSNNPPTANAGSDQNINVPTSSVTLNGSASSDSDGNIVSYQWISVGISNGGATITNPNSANTTVTGLNQGTYTFQLTVTDNDGATDTDTVTIVVGAEQLVPVQIEIDLGDCNNVADFLNSTNVYILKTQTQINTGFITINNGDVLYVNSSATTPFNGGANGYMYRGIQPNQVPNESFVVSGTGVVSAHQVCPLINQLNKTVNFDYNSSNVSQNGHYHTFTLAELTFGTASTNGIQNIRILTLPNRGELAGQGNPITSTPTDFSETNISGGSFEIWGDDTDGNGLAGSYTTQFTFAIVDNNGNDTDIVTMTLNATDTATAPTHLQITTGKCSTDLTGANWTDVYIPNGGLLGNGTVVFTDPALTTPYNGGGTFYRFQTPQGLIYNFQYNVSTTGVVSNSLNCGSGNTGGTLAINNSIPASNGGGFGGTLDFLNGEANEVINLSFGVLFDVDGEFTSANFGSPVSVSILDNLHTSRTGTVTLDSNGEATSTYQVTDHNADGVAIVVTITGRSSSEPIPSSNNTIINV